jgi:predicted ATP-dependent Lon-type protease
MISAIDHTIAYPRKGALSDQAGIFRKISSNFNQWDWAPLRPTRSGWLPCLLSNTYSAVLLHFLAVQEG